MVMEDPNSEATDGLEVLSARLLTIPEAARVLRLRPQSISNWLALGKLKRIKIGRKTFVDRVEIEDFLREALEAKGPPHRAAPRPKGF